MRMMVAVNTAAPALPRFPHSNRRNTTSLYNNVNKKSARATLLYSDTTYKKGIEKGRCCCNARTIHTAETSAVHSGREREKEVEGTGCFIVSIFITWRAAPAAACAGGGGLMVLTPELGFLGKEKKGVQLPIVLYDHCTTTTTTIVLLNRAGGEWRGDPFIE